MKTNLPHIQLYVGDWERDCNTLSLAAEAAWLKIIFKMHLKGNAPTYKIHAKALQILWKSSAETVGEIIEELRFNDICEIEETRSGYVFTSRRFKKAAEISDKRSEAAKLRWEKTNKQNESKTDTKGMQKTDNDNDNDIDNDIEIIKEEKYPFINFWDAYDYKKARAKCETKWRKLSDQDKSDCMAYLPNYVENTNKNGVYPSRQYPQTFLNNKTWNDEPITKARNASTGTDNSEITKQVIRNLEKKHASNA